MILCPIKPSTNQVDQCWAKHQQVMGSPWLEAGPNEAVPNTSSACGVGAIGLLFNDETIPEAI